MNNIFRGELYRGGELIHVAEFKNLVTVEGKNLILDTMFSGAAQIGTWYIGLVNNSPTPSFSENDTLASHSGWTELTTYTGTRPVWDEATAASKTKGTTTASSYTMNGAGTINGAFLCSVASGTGGVLWAAGSFPATIPFVSSDVFKASYSVRF